MFKYFIGAVLGVIFVGVAELLFVCLGGMPMDTKSEGFLLEEFIAGQALRASMGRHVDDPSPISADEDNLIAGAKIYSTYCSACHGELSRPPPPFALGEYPPPPQLLPPNKGVSDDGPGETFWKVKNGIRLTGMPGFRDSLTENEMWQVSLFLSKSSQLSAAVVDSLNAAKATEVK